MPDFSRLQVRTPTRLHFGLWSWGAQYERPYGGLGMMVDDPTVEVELQGAPAFDVVGPAADRVRKAAESFRVWCRSDELPPVLVRVSHLPPRHSGFGVGTQLALAVVQGLAQWTGQRLAPAGELAAVAQRARRSAVGTYGFLHGGLIVDGGRTSDQCVGSLADRTEVPEHWRAVLITPHDRYGMAGEAEQSAFARLPPVPIEVHEHLRRLALEQVVPACRQNDFARFANAVYEYGRLAGSCFASVQGGPYAGPQVTETVELLRRIGIEGVGQSSWGPTVFAFVPDEQAAEQLLAQMAEQIDIRQFDLRVARGQNAGAQITTSAGLK